MVPVMFGAGIASAPAAAPFAPPPLGIDVIGDGPRPLPRGSPGPPPALLVGFGWTGPEILDPVVLALDRGGRVIGEAHAGAPEALGGALRAAIAGIGVDVDHFQPTAAPVTTLDRIETTHQPLAFIAPDHDD